jgi:transposase
VCDAHVLLQQKLTELEQRFTALQDCCAKLEEERDQYRNLYELVTLELARTRRHLFGRKAEVVDSGQAQLAFEAAWPQALTLPSRTHGDGRMVSKKTGATPHGRTVIPEHLPTERIEIPVPHLEAGMVRIGEEVSEKIEWRTGSFVRVLIIRPKYADPMREERGVVIAPVPEQPIPKCKAGVGLLAHVIVSKYADHIPLNRQAKIFERHGLPIPRSSLGGWLDPCAFLLKRITDAMHADAMNAPWIGVDATGVLVQQPEQCHRGHFWVMVASGDHVLFRYSHRHTSQAAHELLKGYRGHVIADAATVFDELYRDEEITEVGCWAHTRRYFFDALTTDQSRALAGIGFIGELFNIERDLAGVTEQTKTSLRTTRAGPVVDAFYEWIEVEKNKVLPKSPIAKAFGYAGNQKDALTRFLKDGRLRLDNNPSELQLRREVVGRKNWLFCGSEGGAKWNTIFVSLIASCELHKIEPWSYLRDVLSLIARWRAQDALALSPKYWGQTLKHPRTQELLANDPLRTVSARPHVSNVA